jgi:hypothetical protein
MKQIVETTGSFQIYRPLEELKVPFDRPAVVQDSFFIAGQIGQRQLVVLATVNDEASDVEFQELYADALASDGESFNSAEFVDLYAKNYPVEVKEPEPVKDPPKVDPPKPAAAK